MNRLPQDNVYKFNDGIDWLVFGAFFDAVRRGSRTPIDVYDMAAWMSITPLSEASCAMGGAPVAIPDFTNGRWVEREGAEGGFYSLDIAKQGANSNT